MIVHRYLVWMRSAPPPARAAATSSLARAYLAGRLDPREGDDAVAAMMLALDDEDRGVRMALAEALAEHPAAPRTVIVGLAADQGDIAAIVLAGSPVVNEAELIHHACVGSLAVQAAIANRADLTAPVAAALAEIGELGAAVTLARNVSAAIPEFAMQRLIDRFGDTSLLRQALLTREDLTVTTRQSIVAACARGLSDVNRAPDMGASDDAAERATVALAALADADELPRLARHLRATGQLTARLILRAFLVGQTAFTSALLAELSGLSAARVSSLLLDTRGAGFAALYRKSRLPARLAPIFVRAIDHRREILRTEPDAAGARLARLLVASVLDACPQLHQPGFESLQVMLRQLETEAAREDARTVGRNRDADRQSRPPTARAASTELPERRGETLRGPDRAAATLGRLAAA